LLVIFDPSSCLANGAKLQIPVDYQICVVRLRGFAWKGSKGTSRFNPITGQGSRATGKAAVEGRTLASLIESGL
jgi:hypothetical protein